MLSLLYSFGLNILELLAQVVAIYNPKVKRFVKGRKTAFATLEQQLAGNTAPLLWVHCSSVGEYEQGRPIIETFISKHSDYKTLISFYSPSGYEAVTDDTLVDFKTYLPIDSKTNAKKLIALINPKIAIFVKYEFWHYYIKALKQHSIPIFSVSAIFREKQVFFKWYGGFFRNILKNFTYFFVQDKASAQFLLRLKLPCSISGDTRIDRVLQIKKSGANIPEIETFINSKPTIAVGSMRKEDIDLVQEIIKAYPNFRFIIAPHEIVEEMMTPLEKSFDCVRFSQLNVDNNHSQVLIIDNIGMLSRLYRYAQFAYIGGGFSDGLHNVLEPAVYEIPVFFGNKDYQRFKEAHDLMAIKAAFAIGDLNDFQSALNRFLKDDEELLNTKKAIQEYLILNQGASTKIIAQIDKFVE